MSDLMDFAAFSVAIAIHKHKTQRTSLTESLKLTTLAALCMAADDVFPARSSFVENNRIRIPISPNLDRNVDANERLHYSDDNVMFYTRFFPADFESLVEELTPLIVTGRHMSFDLDDRVYRSRSAKLTPYQRTLLAIRSLRGYQTLHSAAAETGWSKSSINDDFHHILRCVAHLNDNASVTGCIRWPDDNEKEWLASLMENTDFPSNVIGLCDGKHTQVQLYDGMQKLLLCGNHSRPCLGVTAVFDLDTGWSVNTISNLFRCFNYNKNTGRECLFFIT
jgi:hypothetical protein